MKLTTLSKKTIISISILILALLIIIISLSSLNPIHSTTSNYGNAVSLSAKSNDDGISTLMTDTDADAFIDYCIEDALYDMENIIEARSKGKNSKIIYLTQIDESYFITPNLSQSYYNNKLKNTFNINNEITGTCALIAMIMTINTMKWNSALDIEFDDNGNEVTRNTIILKELYDISTNLYGNNYNPNSSKTLGTPHDTIYQIIEKFYYNHGIIISFTDNYYFSQDYSYSENQNIIPYANNSTYHFDSNVRDDLYNDAVVPGILSIYNYYVTDNTSDNSAHAVALKGEIIYETEYRQYVTSYDLIGKKCVKQIPVYVISDGWYNSDDDNFGNTYQLLVFKDSAQFAHECSAKGWFNYGE